MCKSLEMLLIPLYFARRREISAVYKIENQYLV